jgi:hypothetical protein
LSSRLFSLGCQGCLLAMNTAAGRTIYGQTLVRDHVILMMPEAIRRTASRTRKFGTCGSATVGSRTYYQRNPIISPGKLAIHFQQLKTQSIPNSLATPPLESRLQILVLQHDVGAKAAGCG